MVRFSCVLSDLGRLYPDTEFKEPKLLVSKLQEFFQHKFSLFLKENSISNLSQFSKAIKFLNENTYIPLKDFYLDINNIDGLKLSFIEKYKLDLFNFIPNECKKIKKALDISKLSNKKLLEFKFYLFYKEIIFESVSKTNFNFILNKFHLSLTDFPERTHYLFDDTVVSDKTYVPLGRKQYGILTQKDVLIFSRMDVFYKLLIQQRNITLINIFHKYFLGNYYGIKIFSRDNHSTREIIQYKDEINIEINIEINNRNLEFYDFISQQEINYLKDAYEETFSEEVVDNILLIINTCWKQNI